jgi:bla regulator protein blaR1
MTMIELLPNVSRKFRLALVAATALVAPVVAVHGAAAIAAMTQAGDGVSYVLIEAGSRNSMMSGSLDHLRRAQALRNGSEALLYVRFGDAAYVIRDAATLRKAEAIFAPQQELGERQGELGERQGALGERQARLGAEQARLGALQANAPARRAAELGRQQGELGRQQGALGEQQSALGRQQAELGREQARLGRIAQEQIRELVADAVRRGVAERVAD